MLPLSSRTVCVCLFTWYIDSGLFLRVSSQTQSLNWVCALVLTRIFPPQKLKPQKCDLLDRYNSALLAVRRKPRLFLMIRNRSLHRTTSL